jgi:hypothetical protein
MDYPTEGDTRPTDGPGFDQYYSAIVFKFGHS